jgi:peptidase M23-like protein
MSEKNGSTRHFLIQGIWSSRLRNEDLTHFTSSVTGEPVYAVAEARVVTAVDGLPNTPPGALPEGIALAQADGNHVVLDLDDGRYALYAHLKPGSVRVHEGERVERGQVLGLVGTTGNSSEPHLHSRSTATGPTIASTPRCTGWGR